MRRGPKVATWTNWGGVRKPRSSHHEYQKLGFDPFGLGRSGSILSCRDLEGGKLLYDERIGPPGGYYASPVAANGHLYFASDRGNLTVVKAGDALEVLAQTKLGEPVFASPAIVDNVLYVRSAGHLWAFGE